MKKFGLNAGKYGPEITPYLDAFHAVPENFDVCFCTNFFVCFCFEISLVFPNFIRY